MYNRLDSVQVDFSHTGLRPQRGLEKKKPYELGHAVEKSCARMIECYWKGHQDVHLEYDRYDNLVLLTLSRLTAPGTVVHLFLGDLCTSSHHTVWAPIVGIRGYCPVCMEEFGQISEVNQSSDKGTRTYLRPMPLVYDCTDKIIVSSGAPIR